MTRTSLTLACLTVAALSPLVGRASALPVAKDAGVSAAPKMRRVGPAVYRPFYPASPKEKEIPMRAFLLDVLPVTAGEFLEFVRNTPNWRKGAVNRLFADASYLSGWKAPLDLGAIDPRAPVVEVSWFAAKAYCAARGARLPTEAEWELAATAGEKTADARDEPAWRARILDWYATPMKTLSPVGTTPPNFWGIQDLHGVTWEWVLDFNSTLVVSDARESGDKDSLRFCGAGALGADEKTDYPSFMRIAFRSSLRADYTTRSLGFRCAQPLPNERKTP